MAEYTPGKKLADEQVSLPRPETDNICHHSRQELIELAKNLSSGKYESNSEQREKILKMLVKQLASSKENLL